MTKVTAKQILEAVRNAYPKAAVVREVSMTDPIEQSIYHRWQVNGPQGGWWETYLAGKGLLIADAVPEGWTPQTSIPVRRIDALMREAAGYTAIEIKISRADFKRDTEEKRRAWKAHTRRFVYATPKGLVAPDEVADGCGLWEYDGTGLAVVKKACVNKTPLALPRGVFDTMLYRVSNYEREVAA